MGQINFGKIKGNDDASVYVKYNTQPSDSGAFDTWQNGRDYIGIITSTAKTKPATGYTWARSVAPDVGSSGIKTTTLVVGFTDDCDYNITKLGTTANAQTTINAAITALPTTGGKIILREGVYNITASINLNKDNITLEGMGNSTALKRMANFANGMIYVSAKKCFLAKFNVNGNWSVYQASTNYSVYLASGYNTIQNINVDSSIYGIYLSNGNNNIVNNTFCGNGNGFVVYQSNGYDIYMSSNISNNNIKGNSFSGNNCIISKGNYHNIVENFFTKFGSYGILSYSSDSIISNNIFDTGYCAIVVESSSNNTIIGNSCSKHGSNGIYLNSASNNTVTGNICNDCNAQGIYVRGSNNTISGNTCRNNSYGIEIVTGHTYNLIVGNQLIGNRSGSIYNAGTGTLIRANKNGATNIES